MDFLDAEHISKINELNYLWNNLRELNNLASSYGIYDIFQDNGAKILQQLIYLSFKNLPGSEGNDATDSLGNEWEMKSINTSTSAKGFSTNHHLNYVILNKYWQVPWSFAIYHSIELQEIYVLSSLQLEPMFESWENQLNTGIPSLNNPKIPIKFVKKHSSLIYTKESGIIDNPLNCM